MPPCCTRSRTCVRRTGMSALRRRGQTAAGCTATLKSTSRQAPAAWRARLVMAARGAGRRQRVLPALAHRTTPPSESSRLLHYKQDNIAGPLAQFNVILYNVDIDSMARARHSRTATSASAVHTSTAARVRSTRMMAPVVALQVLLSLRRKVYRPHHAKRNAAAAAAAAQTNTAHELLTRLHNTAV